jgi:hypothetical protein
VAIRHRVSRLASISDPGFFDHFPITVTVKGVESVRAARRHTTRIS